MLSTPYYLIDEEKLKINVSELKQAMEQNWGKDTSIYSYSFKTNSLPWLINYMKNNDFFAEVVSQDEYLLAKRMGFKDDKIVHNGPIKNKETFFRILSCGGYVNIDSSDEVAWLRSYNGPKIKVGIRVNFDLRNKADESTLGDYHGGRFGFSYENGQLENVIKEINHNDNVTVSGLHLHQSLPSRAPEAFAVLAEYAAQIIEQFSLHIEYIDMGGGYYRGLEATPNFIDYFSAISKVLKKYLDPSKVKLIVEPGVSLVSRGFTFVTSVYDVKVVGEQIFVVTDGSRLYLNPQVTRHRYPHHIDYADNTSRKIIKSQWVTGSSCMEYDRLFEIQNDQEVKKGDKIIYDCAGGYTMCLAPMFINYFPPVYVKKCDESLFTAREKWTNDELMQKCYW